MKEADGDIALGIQDVFEFLIIALGTGSIAALCYQFCEHIAEKSIENISIKKVSFSTIYVILLVFYIACFIAYFPGCMSYDSWYITLQALGIIGFDNHHPFLHTFIWSLFAHLDTWTGIRQIGIALYTTTQLLIMLAIYTYACIWIFQRKVADIWKKAAVFYYGANPVFHIFTLILTKDVLFSGFLLLLCITLVDVIENAYSNKNMKSKHCQLAVVSLLCCLFRNNMIYVIIVMIIFLLLKFKPRFSICKGLVASMMLYYFITCVVYPSVGVAEGSIKEMMSVPLSQIAAVYQDDGNHLSEEDRELIFKYIPDVEQYDRFFADNIKTNFNVYAFREDKNEFIRLWERLFKKYPVVFIKAFLALNLPYWYPEMDSVREYIETGNYSQDYQVQRAELLPAVYDWYENVSENEAIWMHLPVFRQLYAIGMPIWIMLFFGIWFYVNRKEAAGAAVLLCTLLWMTYLLGPVSCFRYIEPLLLMYPVWFVLSIEKEHAE